MGSVLSQSMAPPPPPAINAGPGPGAGAAMPGGSALGAGMPPPGLPGALGPQGAPGTPPGGAPGPQLPPPPTHAQTVAALRHFGAIEKGIGKLLKDPECGKSDIRSEAIDMMTDLVGKGITTAGDAVKSMTAFPDMPFEQKKFLETQLASAVQAGNAVLDHHRMAFAGQPAPPNGAYDPDKHGSHMTALTQKYQGMKRA